MLQGTRFAEFLNRAGCNFAYSLGGGNTQNAAGRNGALVAVGAPTRTYGKYGQAATLNGSSDAYNLPPFWVGRGISFGVRFKYTSTTASMTLLDFPLSSGAGTLVYLRVNEGGTGKINCAGISPLFNAVSGSLGLNDGVWHSAVVVYGGNNGTATVFVDGVQVATAAILIQNFQADVPRVGAERWFGSNYSWFNGSVADPFCVRTIMTLGEIRMYHSEMGLSGSSEFDGGFAAGGAATKPWLYRRASSVSRPYLQVA